MKKLSRELEIEIDGICALARTGDFLAVRTTGFFGLAIRSMLSRGLKKCFTNHNAPVYISVGVKQTMQIEPPTANEFELRDYLTSLYKDGGLAILLRPDTFCDPINDTLQRTLRRDWQVMEGAPYDKRSIRMFLRMIFRKRAHIADNKKEWVYCTEGTLFPIAGNIFRLWQPDALKNEAYPAPIHVEHLMRQERVVFIAGNRGLRDRIMAA